MSVWPSTCETATPALSGSEGELVSISVSVAPRDLEDLLEALVMGQFIFVGRSYIEQLTDQFVRRHAFALGRKIHDQSMS